VIQAVHEARDALQGSVSVAYLANYACPASITTASSDTSRAATLDIIGLQKARQQRALWGAGR
jgi:hypothetical protein